MVTKIDKKNKEKKPKRITKERRLEKELLGILLFLGVLIVIFVSASSYFKSLNNFEYEGLTFQKQRLGEIPVFLYSYFFKANTGQLINYKLYLRHDPREVGNIPIEGDSISFKKGKVIFISVGSEELQQCQYGVLAVAGISSFLKDNQFTVSGGESDFWNAGLKRQDWVTCKNHAGNPVIEIFSGNETRIDIENDCYKIQVNDCQVLEAVERFEVQTILDSKNR